jgi:hypothetical protein
VSLANRLSIVEPTRSNRGCVTCKYLKTLSPKDVEAWNQWIADNRSLVQLWEVACADPDNPLTVSITAVRHHIQSHHNKT